MDKVIVEKLCDINEANMTYVNSILKFSTKLSLDVTRPLIEKSYEKAKCIPLCLDTSATHSPPFLLPEVCSCCYTPRCTGLLHSQLQGSYRNARSVRHLIGKKRSMLHKLSSRERMMIDSHEQWSNLLRTRCRVCGHKSRQLCRLPGHRPAPSSRQPPKIPGVLQLTAATVKAITPTQKKKKKKSKTYEGGLIISEDLKQEIQMTMGVQERRQAKKRRRGSFQVCDSKSDACVLASVNNTASELIELDCHEPCNILFDDDSVFKYSPGTLTFESRDSSRFKDIGFTKVVPDEAGKCKARVASRATDTHKSKMVAKTEQESSKGTLSTGTKFVNKSSPVSAKLIACDTTTPPAFKKTKVCDTTTPPALKKTKESDKVSMHYSDSMAPLLRINEVRKKQNERQMQHKCNALKSAFKQSMPPKPTKGIKDFLNTLF